MNQPTGIVIDASLAVWTVLPALSPVDILDRVETWRRRGLMITAPSLWLPEAISAIRRAVYTKAVTARGGMIAVDDLLALPVETVPITPEHGRAAYAWAERLGQSKAYDSFYLALAEASGLPLWTADRRLARSANQAGATWVHWIGEEDH